MDTTVQKTVIVKDSSAKESPNQMVQNLVYFIFGLIEVLLAFRLFLKFAGANPASAFVRFVYNATAMLIWPFQGIFHTAVAKGVDATSVFEPATLVALIVYMVVAGGIVELIAILSRERVE